MSIFIAGLYASGYPRASQARSVDRPSITLKKPRPNPVPPNSTPVLQKARCQAGKGLGFRTMEKKMKTTIVHWGYTGIMEKKMETTI